jgi:glycosyltransferase involved in cell wall biosynthesis
VRIAHVTDGYLPRLGGIEVQVDELARRQSAAGHHVAIVTSVAQGSAPARADGLTVLRPSRGLLPGRTGAIRYQQSPQGCAAVRRGRFDVVHVHASIFSPLAFLAAATAARRRIPAVLTLHSMWAYASPLFAGADRLTRWSRWPIAWSAVSDVAAAPLRAMLGGADVAVLPNAVDADDWYVEHVPPPPGTLRVVSVLRLAKRKRPLDLLRMARAARSGLPDSVQLSLEVIGDGPERGRLERYLREHGMTEWARLRGRLSREQIRNRFAEADVFVAPAVLESFGIAALEARSAGLPVVARRDTGAREFVTDGRDGLLAADDAGMVRAIQQLATRPELLAGMAAHNRAVPPAITWDDVLARCDALYASAARLAMREQLPAPHASPALSPLG